MLSIGIPFTVSSLGCVVGTGHLPVDFHKRLKELDWEIFLSRAEGRKNSSFHTTMYSMVYVSIPYLEISV